MRKILVINEVRMKEVAQLLSKEEYLSMEHTLIEGDVYILSPSMSKSVFLKHYPQLQNKIIVEANDYYQEEDMIQNAFYTAQGVLKILLSKIQQDIRKISIDIIGYGRCGKAIYEYLKPMNPFTRVITRQSLDDVNTSSYENYKPASIIINTQDNICFQNSLVAKCEWIIDIASSSIFSSDTIQSSHYIKAKALPSQYVLKDASKLLAQAIERYFYEQ